MEVFRFFLTFFVVISTRIQLLATHSFGCRSFVKPALSSLFFICHVKKLAFFCEPQFGRISLNISPPHSVLETKKLQAKVLNSTCHTIRVCKQLQNVNLNGFTFLTALVLAANKIILTIIKRILIGLL